MFSPFKTFLGLGFGLAAAVVLGSPAASAQEYGTIKGRLVWGGATPNPVVIVKKGDGSVKDAAVCASKDLLDRSVVVDPDSKGLANCFVYIGKANGTNDALAKEMAAKPLVIDQKFCEYLPFATFVMVNQPVTMKSSDPVNHNVRYTPFSNRPFNQILPPNGQTVVTFNKAERAPTELKCDIHPWMSGWFLVVENPFFSISETDGSFEIKGVPAGKQNLLIRHSKGTYLNDGKARGLEVEVKAGAVTDLGDITIDPTLIK